MKTIKVFYNKTLNMTEGKKAAQCCHAVAGLVAKVGYDSECRIVILEKRVGQFNSIYESLEEPKYMQVDLGLNEVDAGTRTAFAYVVPE